MLLAGKTIYSHVTRNMHYIHKLAYVYSYGKLPCLCLVYPHQRRVQNKTRFHAQIERNLYGIYMRVYVCVYTCACMCVYVCIYLMYVCVCYIYIRITCVPRTQKQAKYADINTNKSMISSSLSYNLLVHACIHTHTHICIVYVCFSAIKNIEIKQNMNLKYIYIYAYIYIYICIYIYIHTYINTHINT